MSFSQIVSNQPLTPAELISALIGIAGLALLAYGIHVMQGSNAERQANAEVLKGVANSLNSMAATLDAHTNVLDTHTAALKKLLEERN